MKYINLVNDIGAKIDGALDTGNIEALRESIISVEALLAKSDISPTESTVLFYYLGNAWSNIDILNKNNNSSHISFESDEFYKSILNFRKCIKVKNLESPVVLQYHTQALTNLGNAFSSMGRIIQAIEYWDLALKLNPQFSMAGCNKAHGLLKYAINLYDHNHSRLLGIESFRLYNKYLDSKNEHIHPNAMAVFISDRNWIISKYSETQLSNTNLFYKSSLGKSSSEKKYRIWACSNRLFLNPLNEVYNDNAVCHDILNLPNITMKDKIAPIPQGFFNEIKQSFISLRYFFYLYLQSKNTINVHYSDKGRNLFNTLDYPQHGLGYEYLKTSFRMAYSTFDKVAFFLDYYLKLNIKPVRINYRSIWSYSPEIKQKIERLTNPFLRALFYISKELADLESDFKDSLSEDSLELATIRNHIEHRYFKLHLYHTSNSDDLFYDDLAYSIKDTDFEEKCLRIIRLSREAVIYLSLAVHFEEKKQSGEGVIIPLHSSEYDG